MVTQEDMASNYEHYKQKLYEVQEGESSSVLGVEDRMPFSVAPVLSPYIKDKIICEVGCECGDLSMAFALFAEKVIAIEKNRDFIKICQSRFYPEKFELHASDYDRYVLPKADFYLADIKYMSVFLKQYSWKSLPVIFYTKNQEEEEYKKMFSLCPSILAIESRDSKEDASRGPALIGFRNIPLIKQHESNLIQNTIYSEDKLPSDDNSDLLSYEPAKTIPKKEEFIDKKIGKYSISGEKAYECSAFNGHGEHLTLYKLYEFLDLYDQGMRESVLMPPFRTPIEIIDLLKPSFKDKIFCEIGCACGDILVQVKDEAKRLIGLDISPTYSEICRERDFEYHEMNVLESKSIPYADVYFAFCHRLERFLDLYQDLPIIVAVNWFDKRERAALEKLTDKIIALDVPNPKDHHVHGSKHYQMAIGFNKLPMKIDLEKISPCYIRNIPAKGPRAFPANPFS